MIVKREMREEILHEFWNPKWIKTNEFNTRQVGVIRINDFGKINKLQGPDFKGAEVFYNGINHCGSIELHVNSSDWNLHGHQLDERYNQVVLHVVWRYDREVYNQRGERLPTLCLEDFFSEKDLQKMQISSVQKVDFICRANFNDISKEIIEKQHNKAAMKELLAQSEETFQWAENFHFDWERTLFVRMMAYSVDPQNRMNAITLANQIPLKIFRRYAFEDYLGWLLAESGIWSVSPAKQKNETEFFIKNYKKNVFPELMPITSWQHRNIRPGGYPIQRMIQFFTWMQSVRGYLEPLLVESSYERLDSLLTQSKRISDAEIHPVNENSKRAMATKKIENKRSEERDTINSKWLPTWNYLNRAKLIQNAILPVWGARRMFLGKEINDDILHILEAGSFELNRINAPMKWMIPSKGYNQRNSYQLLNQYKHFCGEKQCTSCFIGIELWKLNPMP